MPDVRPVNLPDRYFVHGGFNHAAHAQEKCSSCHKAETSKASADLLLPALATCRECHLGEDAVKAEVPSSCAMRSEEHTSELQSLMRISYAVFCLKKKTTKT